MFKSLTQWHWSLVLDWNFTEGFFCGSTYRYLSEESVKTVLWYLGKATAKPVGFNEVNCFESKRNVDSVSKCVFAN